MNLKLHTPNTDFLYRAILQLKTPEECARFFEDMCTVRELQSLSQRVVVAKMLSEKAVYNDIVNATGASTATISRVKRSLEYGCESYAMVFARMEEDEDGQ
ncbi:MAG: TrpR-like protein, YerC/YecD [Ruminococcaceae bacterium]|nr:TrpR-like protein, YerC/YecD [Oscillospiraceae bacterium]MBQ2780384.1 TrpR-like protein, YerC/YecD [Clostridia bacterium]